MAHAARKTTAVAQRVTASHAPVLRPPEVIAIERIAKLATTGAPQLKLVTTAKHIMADWRAERIEPSERRERIEKLIEDVDLGIEAAENFVYDADTEGARRGAQGQLDGLKAVRAALVQELEGGE